MFFYDLCFNFGLKKLIENWESLKLESLHLSWKELIEDGKFLNAVFKNQIFFNFARKIVCKKDYDKPCDSVADYDSDPEPETEPDSDCHPDSK